MPKSTQDSPTRISRRAVLRGAGVAVALPWLESLPVFGDPTTPTVFPKRFGVMFMGNGINENNWSAEGSGADMKISKTLSPLEPLKHKTCSSQPESIHCQKRDASWKLTKQTA